MRQSDCKAIGTSLTELNKALSYHSAYALIRVLNFANEAGITAVAMVMDFLCKAYILFF